MRRSLGKTQDQLAALLCVSTRAVQSFEQGWRRIPTYVERNMILYLSLRTSSDRNARPCWDTRNCPGEWRRNCFVWELQARHFCWFLNGTFCQGQIQESWKTKIQLCRECEVYEPVFRAIDLFISQTP